MTREQHAELDELYWCSMRTVTSLAAQFGLTSSQMNRLITPLPAGFDCWWCQRAIAYRKRSERDDVQRRNRHLTCAGCGAEQPVGMEGVALADSDAAIVAPLFERRSLYGYSSRLGRGYQRAMQKPGPTSDVVRLGVKALAEVGLRWTGVFVVVEAFDTVDAVLARLQVLPTRTLVVPTLTDMMRNEGDSMALFFRLVADGWRVLGAASSHLQHDEYDGWCGDFVERWQPLREQGSRFSRLHLV
ncbi:MAG: hypothetical protein ABMA25_24305 [Ilumatobacteraceae bacterium]